MPSIKDIAMSMINSNPQVMGNPNARSMVEVIASGDSTRGEQIAMNLCKSMGITPQQAVDQARSILGI